MMDLARWIAGASVVLCIGYLCWIVFVRRELFSPMLYVVYGLFHWLMVGQFGTLFLGEQHYEPLGVVKPDTHVIATSLILLSLLAAMLGFHVFAPKNKVVARWSSVPVSARLITLTVCVGLVSYGFLIRHIRTFEIEQASFAYSVTILPLTLPTVAAAVLGAYIFFRVRERVPRRLLATACIGFPLLLMLTSNVVSIFALSAMMFWYLNRNGKAVRAPLWFVVSCAVAAPMIILFSLLVKIVQRPDDLDTVLTVSKFLSAESFEEAIFRFLTLDIFNVENYELFLVVIENASRFSEYKFGVTYFAAFMPFLRLVSEDVRGMGRQLAIDEGFGGGNVGFAIPPVVELYANFGFVITLMAHLLLGIVLARVYAWYQRSSSESGAICYFFLLCWLFLMQRGDAVNALLFPGYAFAVLVVILRAARTRRSSAMVPAREDTAYDYNH